MFFSVQDCLKQQGDQSSDCCTTAARPKKHQDQAEPCALGKLTDHPEAMPQFTIENVIDYLIYMYIVCSSYKYVKYIYHYIYYIVYSTRVGWKLVSNAHTKKIWLATLCIELGMDSNILLSQ